MNWMLYLKKKKAIINIYMYLRTYYYFFFCSRNDWICDSQYYPQLGRGDSSNSFGTHIQVKNTKAYLLYIYKKKKKIDLFQTILKKYAKK